MVSQNARSLLALFNGGREVRLTFQRQDARIPYVTNVPQISKLVSREPIGLHNSSHSPLPSLTDARESPVPTP